MKLSMLKFSSFIIVLICLFLAVSPPIQALTTDAVAFDEVWSELSAQDESELKETDVTWQSDEGPSESIAVDYDQQSPIVLEGDVEEHVMTLPETNTAWLIEFDQFYLAASNPDLVKVEIKDCPLGPGSIRVETPSSFIDQGGAITVDPYSDPPQIKVSSGFTQLMSANHFILEIIAPIRKVQATGAMPLSLINVHKDLLDLELAGDFDLKASDLQTNDLTIQASGNGNYTLGGNVNYASLDFLGNMTLDTEDLETSALHARLDGPMVVTFGPSERAILQTRNLIDLVPPSSGETILLGE